VAERLKRHPDDQAQWWEGEKRGTGKKIEVSISDAGEKHADDRKPYV